jgi:hypothetical protein
MLDRSGQPCETYHSGDSITFRFHGRADSAIPRPVFRLEVHTTLGLVIGGANTRYHGHDVASLEGSFIVDYRIDRLMLVPGAYDISATLFDFDLKDPFDVRHRFQRFYVELGSPPDIDGVTSLGGQWSASFLPGSPA